MSKKAKPAAKKAEPRPKKTKPAEKKTTPVLNVKIKKHTPGKLGVAPEAIKQRVLPVWMNDQFKAFATSLLSSVALTEQQFWAIAGSMQEMEITSTAQAMEILQTKVNTL